MSDNGEYFGGDPGSGPGRRRVLPEGFADVPAGPRLAVLVASIDRNLCNGYELEEVIKAHRRQACWAEAECLATVNELAHTTPGMPDEPAHRSLHVDSMTQAVLEPLLGWSGHHADWYLDLALTLPRLPRVRAALASGELELPEVRTIADRITDADPDLWGAIEDALFPRVLELRGGLLRAKVEAEVVKADPDAATKRHKAKRSDRDVAIWPSVDGAADLSIRGLSADHAVEAYGYIDAIARAVKSSGDPRNLSQLRADIAYSLLAGLADINNCTAPAATDNHAGQSQPSPRPRRTQQSRQSPSRTDRGTVPYTGIPTTTCTTAGVSVATALRHRSRRARYAVWPRSTVSRFTTPPHTPLRNATQLGRTRRTVTLPRRTRPLPTAMLLLPDMARRGRARHRTAGPTTPPTHRIKPLRRIRRRTTPHRRPGPLRSRAGVRSRRVPRSS